MSSNIFIVAAAAGAGLAGLMAVTYVAGRRLDNYAIVDAVWSYQFTPLVLGYLVAFGHLTARHWVLATVLTLWSLRLGTHLAIRIARHHPREDRRYQALRRRWGSRTPARMFAFFQLQGLFTLVLSAPFLLVAADAQGSLGPAAWVGLALSLAGLVGEAVADRQLQRFKATAGSHEICEHGLWRYSRHPNYFFEWVTWLGFGVYALGSPMGWVGLIAPALMLHLLLNVTGVPATETAAVAARGQAYRDYQARTNAFFPGRPRPRAA